MKRITITTLVFSISLFGAIFEHSTDVKEKYWFDQSKQAENKRMAAELLRFQNSSVTLEEINAYKKKISEDTEDKSFEKDVYVDAAILEEMGKNKQKSKVSDDSSCGWFSSLFGCESEETQMQSEESTQKGAEQ